MIANVSLERYLAETRIPLRLSCLSDSGWPVVLSLWYLFEDGHLYCATPQTAKVVGYLTGEPRCAFEIASDLPPYCGVRGRALATIEQARGVEILERLLERYLGGNWRASCEAGHNRKWRFDWRLKAAIPGISPIAWLIRFRKGSRKLALI